MALWGRFFGWRKRCERRGRPKGNSCAHARGGPFVAVLLQRGRRHTTPTCAASLWGRPDGGGPLGVALLRRPFGGGPLRAALGGRPSGGAALWGCASGASGGTRPRPCARRFLWGGASGWCERRKGHGCAHSRRVFFGAVLEVLGGCCVHVHSGPFETCTQPTAYSHGHAFGVHFLGRSFGASSTRATRPRPRQTNIC